MSSKKKEGKGSFSSIYDSIRYHLKKDKDVLILLFIFMFFLFVVPLLLDGGITGNAGINFLADLLPSKFFLGVLILFVVGSSLFFVHGLKN